MVGAATLNAGIYEEVEKDKGATIQALIVVVAVAISAGVGGVLDGEGDWGRGLAYGAIRGVVSWAVWALVAWLVGTTILKTQDTEADWGQLARGTGFAQTPGLLNIFVFISTWGWLIVLLTFLWQLAGMVIAVRQSLDYTSTLRAIFVIVISLIPVIIVNAIIFWALGIGVDPEEEMVEGARSLLTIVQTHVFGA